MQNRFSLDKRVDVLLERAVCCGNFVLNEIDSCCAFIFDVIDEPLLIEWHGGQAFWGRGYDYIFVKRVVGDSYLWMLDRHLGDGRFEVVDRRFFAVSSWHTESSVFRFVLLEDDFSFQFALAWEWLVRWNFRMELVELGEESFKILDRSSFVCWHLEYGDLESWMLNVLGGGVGSRLILLAVDLWGSDNHNQFEFC